MFKTYLQRIEEAGVVGAGGAGFPTHIKINNHAETVIANGAECEPLLRVDQQIMEYFPERVLEGLRIVMKITNAEKGVVCLKEKYHKAVERIREAAAGFKNIEIHLTGNYYPAGDEQQMVFEVTGRVVPVGGLPLDAGVIVSNVSTLLNIANAADHIPVTSKFVTVTGEVRNPVTLNVPIGTPLKTLLEIAKGPSQDHQYVLIVGGPAMGRVETDWEAPVTKTTGGLIVLPSDHSLIKKKTASMENNYKMSKSVCCQCNFCTQLCPRMSLGLGVQPHKVMRAISYGVTDSIGDINSIFACCDCGICSYYACSMGLSPSRIMSSVKSALMKKGLRPVKKPPEAVKASREYIKVPMKRFIQRLGILDYDLNAPMQLEEIRVNSVKIPLKQHIGAPAVPLVGIGDIVEKGKLIGISGQGKVGANVHASIAGLVTVVCDEYIEIKTIGQGGGF